MRLIAKNKVIAVILLLSFLLAGCVDSSSGYKSNYQSTPSVEKPSVNIQSDDGKVKAQEETYNEDNLSNDNYYINSAGNKVHSPAHAPSKPAGASAKCRDGTYSFSQNRRGTCSHHGGVAEWY